MITDVVHGVPSNKMADNKQETFDSLPMSKPLYELFHFSGVATTAGFLFVAYRYGSFIPVSSSFSIGTKLGYTFKWMLLPSASVFFAIADSAMARRKYKAHPLAGKDHQFQIQKNVLMNTIEQYSLFCIPLLALGASVQTEKQLRFIPTLCVLFFVARVLFRLGYPNYRGFGYAMNFGATVFNFGANIYLTCKYGFLGGIENM